MFVTRDTSSSAKVIIIVTANGGAAGLYLIPEAGAAGAGHELAGHVQQHPAVQEWQQDAALEHQPDRCGHVGDTAYMNVEKCMYSSCFP